MEFVMVTPDAQPRLIWRFHCIIIVAFDLKNARTDLNARLIKGLFQYQAQIPGVVGLIGRCRVDITDLPVLDDHVNRTSKTVSAEPCRHSALINFYPLDDLKGQI